MQEAVDEAGAEEWTPGEPSGITRFALRRVPRLASPAETPATKSPAATMDDSALRTTLRRARTSIFRGTS